MSVRAAFLVLLGSGPRHGYQLKADFDDATGDSWPLNFGQVYTTLQRLEKAGAVANLGEDEDGRIRYELTDDGRTEAEEWMASPVQQPLASRDEIAMKVLLAVRTDPGRATSVIDVQRQATMSTLQTVTRMRSEGGDLPWLLHLDRTAMLAEAELRWLDRAEERLDAEPDAHSPAEAETSPTPIEETT